MTARGMTAYREMAARVEAERAHTGDRSPRVREFYLRAGESAEGWLIGSPDTEPYIAPRHYLGLSDAEFDTVYCAAPFVARGLAQGCVYCQQRDQGDRRISKVSDSPLFSFVDMRWTHKERSEAKSKGQKYEKFDFRPCSDDDACRDCDAKVPRQREGLKLFTYALKWLEGLFSEGEDLSKFCVNCEAKIGRSGCGCANTVAGSIFAAPVRVKQTGRDKTKLITFKFGKFQEAPAWVQEIAPINFDEAIRPKSASEAAKQLNCSNPYERQERASQATSYEPGARAGGGSTERRSGASSYGGARPVSATIPQGRPIADDEDAIPF